MSEDFNDFRRRVLKITEKRTHKIKDSIGVRDAFLWCRKRGNYKKYKPNEKDFYRIIRTINKLLAQELLESRDVSFPQRMGQLEPRKYYTYLKFVDGKIKTTRGINWKATLELWRTDNEALEAKTLVRSEDKEGFKIYYNKTLSNYNNKVFVQFKPNRELIAELNNRAKEGLIDAFKIGQ